MKKTVLLTIACLLLVLIHFWPDDVSVGVAPTPQPPTYFAEIDDSGIVLRVIVADQNFINSGAVGEPTRWIQTDIHGAIKKNFAGKGFKYDSSLDAFIPPTPRTLLKTVPALDPVTATWVFDTTSQ